MANYKNLDVMKDHFFVVLDKTANITGLLEKDGTSLEISNISLFKSKDNGKAAGGFIGNKNKLLRDKFEIKNIVLTIKQTEQVLGLYKIVDGVMSKVVMSGAAGVDRKVIDAELYEHIEKAINHMLGFSIQRGSDILIKTDFESFKRLKAFELDWIGDEGIDFQVSVDSKLSAIKNETLKCIIGYSETYDGTSTKSVVLAKYFETQKQILDSVEHDVLKLTVEVELFGYLNK